MELTEKQYEIVQADGHLLVRGGPGSGKTTVSIIKAADITQAGLSLTQKVMFLSFARATVSRVMEAIEYEQQIPSNQKRRIDVETYHSFFWRILKTHGYLVGLPRRLSILTPPNEAIELSVIRRQYAFDSKLNNDEKERKRKEEHKRQSELAYNEGKICFDLFASLVGDILNGSERVRKLIGIMYPYIILDEFQDTNHNQWRVVQELGKCSKLIALADPEQQIFGWLGADPNRLEHFNKAFSPTFFDLGSDNHRSTGTDINRFGNDILTGHFTSNEYSGIQYSTYEPNQNQAFSTLITTVFKSRKRLAETKSEAWTLAVLVPTKKLMRLVSDNFRKPPAKLQPISHSASIDMEGAILAAEVIAYLLQSNGSNANFSQFIEILCNYFRGKGGDAPTQGNLEKADKLFAAHDEFIQCQKNGKNIRKNSIINATHKLFTEVSTNQFSGDPAEDWRYVRGVLENGECARLKDVASEARNIRVLERGNQLRVNLAQDWRDNGAYANALDIIRQAFVNKHFAMDSKPETGVLVMNMHKAKGKQFDEVIIFEGWPRRKGMEVVGNPDRIVRSNKKEEITDYARQNFRVSVTRARAMTTILTPKNDPCVLLS